MDKLPKRKQMRLKHYDYSQQGLYFVTICCQNHSCYYGSIKDDSMQLNHAGMMIEKWYLKIPRKFTNFSIRDYVIMPNHFHCVLEIIQSETAVANTGATIPSVVQWFKTMTTNDYIKNVKTKNWQRFDKKLWQRSYYEHVIRSETSHQKIVDYIQYNPQKWTEDKYYKPN
ncbi:MAG: transposase [Proteobacteria bacterium]|nr:transposase [Pseudomonadota bacterium]